jgi:glucans biosynthesis protein C
MNTVITEHPTVGPRAAGATRAGALCGPEVTTSSSETLTGPVERQYWADNLRVLVIAAVVVFHTATAYLGGPSWYFMQRTTSGAWSALTFPGEVIAVFALGPLFLVAGWFAARSLAHRGADAFARARLLRLGVPLIAFIFLVNGLSDYVGQLRDRGHPSLTGLLRTSFGLGPMWFVAALLTFSLAYFLLRRLGVPAAKRRRPAAQVVVAAAALIAVTAFLTWQRWPLDDGSTFLDARWAEWPQGAVLFAVGAWAGEAGFLDDLAARARRLGWSAVAAVTLLAGLLGYEQSRGALESTLHGAGWSTILMAVLYGIISVTYAVWFTATIRARWSGSGPLRARAGQASYASYFLHPLVVTAIMVAFASLALAPELKFLIVAVAGVPACFLVGFAMTRIPRISKALLTASKPAARARRQPAIPDTPQLATSGAGPVHSGRPASTAQRVSRAG